MRGKKERLNNRWKVRDLFKHEKRERILLTSGLVIVFAVLIGLTVFLSASLLSLARLEMENAVERAFNDVILALQDDDVPISTVMSENHILGVGVYSGYGNLIYSVGPVYLRLPLTEFQHLERDPLTNSITNYDSKTNKMEYIRFSNRAIIPSGQSLLLPVEGSFVNFPNVIYLSFDGSSYNGKVIRLRLAFFCAITMILVFLYIVLRISAQNRKYKQQLIRQESLVSLGQAARTLTHEIKNPLSAITLQLALLKRSLGKENQEDLKVIENETQRLIQLTNKVSDFLRNPLGQPEHLDLVQSVKNLFPLFGDSIRWVDSSIGSGMIYFDRERLRSVFENILKNAIEACDGMTVDVEVEITRSKRGRFHVFVRDRGCGIKAGDERKIFDPFFTTKIHGSGIGLAITRQFLAAGGAELGFKKRDGGGTIVEVIIPESKRGDDYENTDLR